MAQNVIPVVVVVTSTNPVPGGTATVTVTVDDTPDNPHPIAISSSPAGAFSSIPSSVDVLPGNTQVAFNATLSGTASGSVSVSATAHGVTKTGTMLVISDP